MIQLPSFISNIMMSGRESCPLEIMRQTAAAEALRRSQAQNQLEKPVPRKPMTQKISGESITHYREKILQRDPKLAEVLEETEADRLEALRRVKELGLPHYRETTSTVAEFLAHPDKYFCKLKSQH